MRIKVNNHASVVIAYRGNEIFSNIYDFTYPKELWRGRINLLGGGQSPGDTSPLQLLRREIEEEFKIVSQEIKEYDNNFQTIIGKGMGAPQIRSFATLEDIATIRNSLLQSKPWRDYLVALPSWKGDLVHVIFSVYTIELSHEAMTCIKKNIKEGKSLVCEGFLRVTSLDDLKNGKILTAWAAGVILSEYFKIGLPNPEHILCQDIGVPRISMKEYYNEYDYLLK